MPFLLPKSQQKIRSIDPIDGGKVFDWNESFKKRSLTDLREIRLVDTSKDLAEVSFHSPVLQDLLSGSADDDFIVFKFICNSPSDAFSGLNITPVIMKKYTKDILKYSNFGGNNTPLGNDKDTDALFLNFKVRKLLLENLPEYRNDVLGIAYSVAEFKGVFGPDPELKIYLMLDELSPSKPKTNVALMKFDRTMPTRLTKADFLKLSLYDNGSECCPIGK